MKTKKNRAVVGLVAFAIAFAFLGTVVADGPLVRSPITPGRPNACAEYTACTPGQTCCWGTVGAGAHQATCGNNGIWGLTLVCYSFQVCSSYGVGGRCVNTGKSIDLSVILGMSSNPVNPLFKQSPIAP